MSIQDIPLQVITAAFLATLLISLAPNLILFLFPHYAQNAGKGAALSIGQALAAGALLGDVFLHTLPHTMMEGHDSPVGQWVLVGFTTFWLLDLLVRSVSHGDPTSNGHGHPHSHSHSHAHSHEHASPPENNNKETNKSSIPFRFNSTVILNLAADALHNFTDGLAIGASFASSTGTNATVMSLLQSRGGLASLSVLLHELPHELGDFAILVGNGMSKHQAITAQFTTAIAAFAGTMVGLAASTSIGHDILIPFTAGGFVYLSAVSILPELLQEPNVGKLLRMAQVVAFGIGIAFMQLVAILEELEGHDHGHSHNHHEHHRELHDDHGHHDHFEHAHLHHDHDHLHHDHHSHHHEHHHGDL